VRQNMMIDQMANFDRMHGAELIGPPAACPTTGWLRI
jgi:hypothetical protein